MLFPRRCPVCEGIVPTFGGLICPSCFHKLSFVKSPTCKKCGKEVLSDTIEYCSDCARRSRSFQYGMALLNYNEAAARSMARIKYHNKREYLDFYSQAAAARYGKRIKKMNVDAFVPVPVHPSKLKARGFNQAQVFAEKLGEQLGIPALSDVLIRDRKTEPQKNLSPRERFANLQHAFHARELPDGVRHIMLIDDIYTTGSTIEACTRALKKAGAENIYFLTICIGYGK